MVRYSKSNIAIIIVITFLVFLNVALFVNGISLSCDKCVVTFKNLKVSGVNLDEPQIFAEVKASELYESFSQGYCTIRFDRVQGYYYG